MEAQYRVGIDVGGTFTDIYLFEELSGRSFTHKVSSTPESPHRAPVEGLAQILQRIGATGDQVSFVGLGTTVAINALLEGKGARTGLITTHGFRDLLEIGRQTRPSLYDPFARKPKLLVPRHLRCEVHERLDADGSVATPLDAASVHRAVSHLKAEGVESVAICFINSYVDPKHENLALEMLREAWPDVHAVTSFKVMPEFREYERFLSTVVNAYLMPSMRDYFAAFKSAIAGLGIRVPPMVMNSSGGVFTPEVAGQRPIDTLFSGPSGGVSGAMFLAAMAEQSNIVTFDMGGTSTEVCLVRDGTAQLSHQRTVEGYTVRTTSHDIHTIGAGGSSIGRVDLGGMLKVGPESAGSRPGPACYGRGGEYATVTDANVVLGRLNQAYLLAGSLKIDAAKSARIIDLAVAQPKGWSIPESALAMIQLAEANMAQALRVVSVERGLDPRAFMLVALGGAGPLHAASVAKDVGMAGVIVPPHPGVLCAMGVLTKDVQLSFSRTKIINSTTDTACEAANSAYRDIESEAADALVAGHILGAAQMHRSAAVRYRGQNHEISINVPDGVFDEAALRVTASRFHEAHKELYGYCFEHQPIELVTLRLAAVISVDRPRIVPEKKARTTRRNATPATHRRTIFQEGDPIRCPVYERGSLEVGDDIAGPAIIEQMDTTTIVPPGFSAEVDVWKNLIITWPQGGTNG